jgi:DNA-binding response OmpR family regulator
MHSGGGFQDQHRRRILIAEDDAAVASVAARYLEREGFLVDLVDDGASAVASTLESPPALLVLDLALPKGSGLSVLRQVRPVVSTPVVVVSGRRDMETKIQALRLGADDYLTKPFSPRELVARVHTVLRRAGDARVDRSRTLETSGVILDLRERCAVIDGARVELTGLEHALLLHFMQHPGRTFSRGELLRQVWDLQSADESTVTALVKRLRNKVEPDPANPWWIKTVWGAGYRFET